MSSRNRSLITLVSLGVLFVLLLPQPLRAHALLVESFPKANSHIQPPTLSLRLRFNVRVDGSRSRCTLVSPTGDTIVLALDSQSKPNILTSRISGLTSGEYKVSWQVLAADGHISRGEFTFTVS
jgi:methionine-rich copper-binding protein CopC